MYPNKQALPQIRMTDKLHSTTQVPEEGCDLEVYKVGKKYSEHPGILQAGDMTTEALVAKIIAS